MTYWAVIPIGLLSEVDFTQFNQTSASTVRRSVNGMKCLLSYESITPPSLCQGFPIYRTEKLRTDILTNGEW